MKRLGPFSFNRCDICGRFKAWERLIQRFVPDSDYSSEDDSWQECVECKESR